MHKAQLLEHVDARHRAEVEALLATYVKTAGPKAAEEGIDSFANALCERGLLSAEALQEFLTFHELTVGELEDATAGGSSYELMTLIGRGAMGEVYLGRDPRLKRTVAVKRVHAELADDPLLLQRFFNEAQVTAQLDHPAIVPVYGLDKGGDGALSYAMKLVRGVTLTQYLDEAKEQLERTGAADQAHSLKARIETFIPVLNALAYAHRRGVVHRDLKPDNVMVGRFGQVLVMDWGIARVLGAEEGARAETGAPGPEVSASGTAAGSDTLSGALATQPKLTLAGSVLGTPAYMSPEQAAGREIDARSDQYTLGLMLQEIVTLGPARASESMPIMIARAVRGVREPVTSRYEKVPRELAAIIARATAPRREERYASVAALAEDLKRFLRDESVEADPDRGVRKVTRWIGRHRERVVALGITGAVLATAVVLFFVWRSHVAVAAEREAAQARERAMATLAATVDAQGKRMSARLARYEALLEGITMTAAHVLARPAPPSDAVVYRYSGGRREPEALPGYAKMSKYFKQMASLRADFVAAPEVDLAAHRSQIDQLAELEPVLRRALLRSIDEASAELPFPEAEARVLDGGAPILWAYLHTERGLAVGLPGTWEYDDSEGKPGYDHRREDWYRLGLGARAPAWTASADENGLGLTVNAVQAVRGERGEVLGVAGIDIALARFIDELLEIPALSAAGAEALLLDQAGMVIVRSSQKEIARTMSEYDPVPFEEPAVVLAIATHGSGHLGLADGERLAVWTQLGSAGLTYLIVGPERALIEASAR